MKRVLAAAALLALSMAAWPEGPLTLQEAVRLASSSSPAVKAAEAEAQAAKAAVKMRRAAFLPQLSLNGFAVDSKAGSIIQSGPGRMTGSISQAPKGQSWMGGVMAMLPLYTGGVLDAGLAQALAEERAAQAEVTEMKQEAAQMTEEAFLASLLAEAEIEAARARVEAVKEMVRTARARLEAGSAIGASVDRAEAERASAERALAAAENEKAKSLIELQASLGGDLSQTLTVEGRLTAAGEGLALEKLLASAGMNRGIVLKARAMAEAASARVKAAQGSSLPAVFLQAMQEQAEDSMMSGRTVGLTFTMPLFDGGERSSQVREAKAMTAKARQGLRLAELTAEKQVRQAWLDLQTAKAATASAEAGVASARSAYEVVSLRTAAGKSLLLEQLDSLQVLTEARRDLARSLYDQGLALARIRRASGAGLEGAL